MRRSFKFLLRPTGKQAAALGEMLRDHCSLYNAALQERRDAYRHVSKTTVRYGEQSAQLKDIRAFDPEHQGRWSFFRRVKAGQKPGYPRFRGVSRFDTVEYPKDGDGCRWDCAPHGPVTRVRLQGVGHVRVHQHRPIAGTVKTVSVTREGRRWYVVLSCEDVPAEPLPATGRQLGVDLGVTHFLTTSDGEHVPNRVTWRPALSSSRRHSVSWPRSAASTATGAVAGTRPRPRRSPLCTARFAASAVTTTTRSRCTWCALRTSSRTNS